MKHATNVNVDKYLKTNKTTILITGCKVLVLVTCNYFLELWFIEFINKYVYRYGDLFCHYIN